jgi:hypothetical protein
MELVRQINDLNLKSNIDKISKALELVRDSGFEIKKLNNFTFDKISYQMLIAVNSHSKNLARR